VTGVTESVRRRRLGLAQLSLLDHDPPSLVDVAAQAGYDFVGVRVRTVTPSETPFDLSPGSPLLADTLRRMDDTGVGVEDIEFVLLDGVIGAETWKPALEAGAALGATSLTVAIDDTDDARAVAALTTMGDDARQFGIALTVEPIAYNALHSIPDAARVAEASGCLVLLDTLHVARFGATAEEIRAVGPLVSMLQLCDGPATPPADRDGLVAESRFERAAPGEGEFDLRALIENLPADLPVSVEVPSASKRKLMGPVAYARHLREAAEAVLARDTGAAASRLPGMRRRTADE